MEYNIYLDVFFFVNFTMNLLLLAGCGRILRMTPSLKSSLFGAAFGAAASAIVLLFGVEFVGCRLLIAAVMGRIAYGKEKAKILIKRGLVLFFGAFVLSGAVSWLSQMSGKFLETKGIQGKEAFLYLIAGGFLSLTLFGLIRGEEKQLELLYPVRLNFKGRKKEFMGLYDTGNRLSEPITGRPVHIAEYEAVKDLMPKSYQEIAENYMDTGTLELTKVTKLQMYEFTFLSYHSIGNEKGQLLGIRMDSAVFTTKAGEKTEEKVVIGLSKERLSGEGRYQIIINRRLEI